MPSIAVAMAPRAFRRPWRDTASRTDQTHRRLMQQAGLRGHGPKRFVPRTTDSDHDQPVVANRLAQAAAPTGSNQIWVSD